MNEIKNKIKTCRQHWQQLAPHVKDRPTAKHLIAAVEIAEHLLREEDVCCCGSMMSEAKPYDSICAHGGCRSAKEYAMDKPKRRPRR